MFLFDYTPKVRKGLKVEGESNHRTGLSLTNGWIDRINEPVHEMKHSNKPKFWLVKYSVMNVNGAYETLPKWLRWPSPNQPSTHKVPGIYGFTKASVRLAAFYFKA